MKLKNILYVISLFIISSAVDVNAKDMPMRKAAGYDPNALANPEVPQKQAPAQPKSAPKTSVFNNIMSVIRQKGPRSASEVLANDGTLDTEWVEYIKKQFSDRDPQLIRAALEASVNLVLPYLQLPKNSEDAAGIIEKAMNQVDVLMGVTKEVITTENFYDPETDLFDKDYLDKMVKRAKEDGLEQRNAERVVMNELMPSITKAWKRRDIAIVPAHVEAARQQIQRSVAAAMGTIIVKEQARTPFYDDKTNLMNNEYLTKLVKTELSLGRKPEQILERLYEEYKLYVIAEWRTRGIRGIPIQKLMQQIGDVIAKETGKEIITVPQPIIAQQPAQQEEETLPVPQPIKNNPEDDAIGSVTSRANAIMNEVNDKNLKPEQRKNIIAAIDELLKLQPQLIVTNGYIEVGKLIAQALESIPNANIKLDNTQKAKITNTVYHNYPRLKP